MKDRTFCETDMSTSGWDCKHCGLPEGRFGQEYKGDPSSKPCPAFAEPEKKQYKLSEMWKVWFRHEITYGVDVEHLNCMFALSKTGAQVIAEQMEYNDNSIPVAITRADATEFYEGEGL